MAPTPPGNPVILVRADATRAIGTGHAMRCLAVAEALGERGYRCRYAMVEAMPGILARLGDCGIETAALPGPASGAEDLAATLALARRQSAAAIILDGYHFAAAYRAGLRRSGLPILTWHDGPEPIAALHADLVVDTTPDRGPESYRPANPGARLLLGRSYIPIRSEIRRRIGADRRSDGTILVTFGGSDPLGLTAPVASALLNAAEVRLTVVAGALADSSAAETLAARFPDRLRLEINAASMGELMAEARLAITAGGGTVAELAALGVPSVVVGVADNQQAPMRQAAAEGWCLTIDGRRADAVPRIAEAALALWRDVPRLDRLSRAARGLIDGRGAPRIAEALDRMIRGS